MINVTDDSVCCTDGKFVTRQKHFSLLMTGLNLPDARLEVIVDVLSMKSILGEE